MVIHRATVVLASTLVLAACGASGADDGRTSVVTAFHPLQFVADRVGGEHVAVTTLTSPGGEPHDLELTPKQVGSVQDADVVVLQAGFQTAVDDAVEQAGRDGSTTVDAASLVELLDEEDEHPDHDHGGVDPHLWLDPANMVAITEAVEDALAQADPARADAFRANADALVADLRALDEDFTEGLARCRVRDVVTSHAAFGYLADAYDLRQQPIAGLDPGTEPSGADLARLADLVRDEGITTVFTERLVSPAIARTVAREAGVETATLDPVEGLTSATSDEDYLSIMRTNLETLRKANDCP